MDLYKYIIITLSSSAYSCIHELMRGGRKEGRLLMMIYMITTMSMMIVLLTDNAVSGEREGRMNTMRDKKE